MSIDDVMISNDVCDVQLQCDFERGFDGFFNTRVGDTFDWMIKRGKETPDQLGPHVDHTLETQAGQFAYVEQHTNSRLRDGDKAWLISEALHTPEGGCINWFMYLDGKYIQLENY